MFLLASGFKLNNDVFRWAVDLSGIPVDKIRPKFKKIDEWMDGTAEPTHCQLRDLSKFTKIPYGYFILSKPFEEDIPLLKYRTIKNKINYKPSRSLIDIITNIQQKQDWMRDYLISDGAEKLDFVGSFTEDTDPKILANEIRNRLGINYDETIKLKGGESGYKMYKYLRQKTESLGIVVMHNGIVGENTHRVLDVEEFRAFVMIDEYVPFIFLNAKDSYTARCFSLCHELAHIWLGTDEIYNVNNYKESPHNKTEVLCNETAAELLIPAELLKEEWNLTKNSSYEEHLEGIEEIAKKYNISSLVVSIRAKNLELMTHAMFDKIYSNLSNRNYKTTGSKDEKTGGDYYKVKQSRLGDLFLRTVVHSAEYGEILYTDAYNLLDVNRLLYDKLLENGDFGNVR